MKIVFMGTPDFSVPCLRELADHGYDIVGVITAPDRPSGRGRKLTPSPVKEFALSRGFKVLQPEKLRNPEFLEELKALKPDLAVVVAFRMLPEVVWRIPSKGTFNLHASSLPDYRGAAPINWVLMNGETETGMTTFFIDDKIDTGAMLLQEKVAIPDEWTAGDLHDYMMEAGAKLVLKTAQMIEEGKAEPKPQDHSAFNHPAPKLFKDNCEIDWRNSAEELYHFIRGLSPYPTAWTALNGKVFKVYRAERMDSGSLKAIPGAIVTDGKKQLAVCTGAGWLKLTEVQVQGKKRMDTASFLAGYKEELKAFDLKIDS